MHRRIRSWRVAGAALTALALVGCAPLPPLGEHYQQKTAEDFATAQSLAAREGSWPADDWWRGYGDAQLDALMAEALKDSPDLAIAQARVARARAMAEVAGAPLWPQVSAGASGGTQRNSYN